MPMTTLELASELESIYGLVKQGLDRSPEGLLMELDTRCQWLARSAELEAEAQTLVDYARGNTAEQFPEANATRLREILGKECAEENRLYKLAERLNSTLVHQIDAIRSILSYEKESRRHG